MEFGLELRGEARRRGIGWAKVVVFLGDGAAWIWRLARFNPAEKSLPYGRG
jgi:hypothetical protein